MGRRCRRRSSPVGDVAAMYRRGPWWKPVAFGALAFLVFSMAYPLLVHHLVADKDSGMFRPVLDQVLGRQLHRTFLIGTACLLLGAGLSAWKYWRHEALGRGELQAASFLSRLLARWIH